MFVRILSPWVSSATAASKNGVTACPRTPAVLAFASARDSCLDIGRRQGDLGGWRHGQQHAPATAKRAVRSPDFGDLIDSFGA